MRCRWLMQACPKQAPVLTAAARAQVGLSHGQSGALGRRQTRLPGPLQRQLARERAEVGLGDGVHEVHAAIGDVLNRP